MQLRGGEFPVLARCKDDNPRPSGKRDDRCRHWESPLPRIPGVVRQIPSVEGGRGRRGIPDLDPIRVVAIFIEFVVELVVGEELGDVEFEAFAAMGRAMAIEQSITYALEDQE